MRNDAHNMLSLTMSDRSVTTSHRMLKKFKVQTECSVPSTARGHHTGFMCRGSLPPMEAVGKRPDSLHGFHFRVFYSTYKSRFD